MSDALVGPGVVVKTGVPASATPGTQTVRFDRTGVAEKFIFESPIGGLGPLNPYQAVRAFLSSGAGLVLLALAGLVGFPTRARNAGDRLEGSHGAEVALGAGLVVILLTLAAITLLRFTLGFLSNVPI